MKWYGPTSVGLARDFGLMVIGDRHSIGFGVLDSSWSSGFVGTWLPQGASEVLPNVSTLQTSLSLVSLDSGQWSRVQLSCRRGCVSRLAIGQNVMVAQIR